MRCIPAAAAAAALIVGFAAVAQPTTDPPEARAHVERARALAGTRFASSFARACTPPALRPQTPAPAHYQEPTKVFDNLYYLGVGNVDAWAVDTPDGIVLIDALNNQADAETAIEGGLRKLGADPARIRYIVVTHAHGDHFGGASYLAGKYGAPVLMSPTDWSTLAQTASRFPAPRFGPPPTKGLDAIEGQNLVVGGVPFRFVNMPGHTPGAISVMFPVRNGARTHMALLMNGVAAQTPEAYRQMLASHERQLEIAREARVEVELVNHSFVDNALERLAQVRNRRAGEPHPYLLGEKGVQDFLGFLNACMRADLARPAAPAPRTPAG